MSAASARSRFLAQVPLATTVAALAVLLNPTAGRAGVIICEAAVVPVRQALARIERSDDPCGESARVRQTLSALETCSKATYRICIDTSIHRNTFDRAREKDGGRSIQTITWNPDLRGELEMGCDGDSTQPVLRDPTASLLHEIAHAVQDCQGMNPGEHEADAVRIENIYRRAAGLCQRSRYGDESLPSDVWKLRQASAGICAPSSDGLSEAKRQETAPASARRADQADGGPRG